MKRRPSPLALAPSLEQLKEPLISELNNAILTTCLNEGASRARTAV
jgi:hypothetical protein